MVFQNQRRDDTRESILKNKPLTQKFGTNPPKYFESIEGLKSKGKSGAKKYSRIVKRQKEKEIQEMFLKNQMYPQKYENTYFITDKEQIGLLYEDKSRRSGSKTKKKRGGERLRNIRKNADLNDPEKLKNFLEEDRRITKKKKNKYLSNAKKKGGVGSKMNSIHLKFYKDGADKRTMLPKVYDNRIAMLRENEQKRMERSARKIHNLNNNFRDRDQPPPVDISEANKFYLSNFFNLKGN
jgi:hypothetical protein